MAKLSGGVAVIKVGAATETELKEMKLRIEDALNATRAAVEEGIVAGGGTALANVISAVETLELEGDEATGRNIVLRALEEPVRQIAHNAGYEGSIVIDRLKHAEVGTGFNAATGEWVNMIEAGIIDPVKVSRSALQNAMVQLKEIQEVWAKAKDVNVHLTIDREQEGWDGHVGFVPNYVKELDRKSVV